MDTIANTLVTKLLLFARTSTTNHTKSIHEQFFCALVTTSPSTFVLSCFKKFSSHCTFRDSPSCRFDLGYSVSSWKSFGIYFCKKTDDTFLISASLGLTSRERLVSVSETAEMLGGGDVTVKETFFSQQEPSAELRPERRGPHDRGYMDASESSPVIGPFEYFQACDWLRPMAAIL